MDTVEGINGRNDNQRTPYSLRNVNGETEITTTMEYAMAVWLVNKKQVYLCRRLNTPTYKGKWQPVWRELAIAELPMDGAVASVKEQMGLDIDKDRLQWAQTLSDDKITKMCWVYLVHLKDDELPSAPQDPDMTDWVLTRLDKATILDLIPGFRVIAINLLKSLKKVSTK